MAAQLAQIALCTTDIPRSVQLYSEAFGFAEAGGKVLWGPRVAHIQGLGEDAAFTLWWLVGRHGPRSARVLPPYDAEAARRHGPGAERPRLDALRDHRARLRARARAASPASASHRLFGSRSSSTAWRKPRSRDPYTGALVEVLEEGAATPGGIRPRFSRPRPRPRLRDSQRFRPRPGAALLRRHARPRGGARHRAAPAGAGGALGARRRPARQLRRARRRRLPRGRWCLRPGRSAAAGRPTS